ncbi:MotA/TolQ/ExbB proton channel family protein, partial [Rhodovulum sulfidophilum]|nr:MotA/TolQ/ExbB proton channel family protein [Rhodovulum sulfidophilum]
MIGAVIELLRRVADLGGPVVLILIGISVLTVAVVLYKLWQFAASGVGRHRALSEAVAHWDRGERARARAA